MSGYVDVEIRIDKSGSFSRKIIGHGEGSSCLTEDDEALLDDLLEAEIEGYHGTFGTVNRSDVTQEYKDELEGKEQNIGLNPFTVEEEEETKATKKDLSLGFDV